LGSLFYFCFGGRLQKDGSEEDADWVVDKHATAAAKFLCYKKLILENGPETYYIDRIVLSFVEMINQHARLCDPSANPPSGYQNTLKDRGLKLKFHGQIEGCLRLNGGEIEVLDSVQVSPRVAMLIETVNLRRRDLLTNPAQSTPETTKSTFKQPEPKTHQKNRSNKPKPNTTAGQKGDVRLAMERAIEDESKWTYSKQRWKNLVAKNPELAKYSSETARRKYYDICQEKT
jgi:hypothetical protein